jgi:hypothetical protein
MMYLLEGRGCKGNRQPVLLLGTSTCSLQGAGAKHDQATQRTAVIARRRCHRCVANVSTCNILGTLLVHVARGGGGGSALPW